MHDFIYAVFIYVRAAFVEPITRVNGKITVLFIENKGAH